MDKEIQNAREGEDKALEAAKAEAEQKAKEEAEAKAEAESKEKEATLGEILKEEKPDKELEKKKEARLVPEAVLLEYKSQNKELRKDIKDLREMIESGASKLEVSKDLEEIAEEHNVDLKFLQRLAKKIRDDVTTEVEEKFSSRVKPIEEKEKTDKINKAFDEHYAKALVARPEFKDIAQKEVIKILSLNSSNANKTFSQILEESYGHLISGKKTLEATRGRGGNETINKIDYDRAARDTEYFQAIMADPELKREYNKDLGHRLRL